MVKQARAEATREAIVRGAAEVFDRYGYGSTTLSDIVGRSGVTKGALYFHFSSKEDLAAAVVDKYESLLVEPARGVLDDGHALEAVIRLSQEFAGQLLSDVVVRAGVRLTLEQGTFGTLSSRSYQQWLELVEELMRRSADEGDVRSAVDAPSLARFIVASFTGVQMLSQVFTGRSDLMLRVQEMWNIVLPSLVPARLLPHFRRVAAKYELGSDNGAAPNGQSVTTAGHERMNGTPPLPNT